MRDAFAGRYRPTKEEFDRLWDEALFVFDANVLLNLYRYSEGTREQLLAVLRALGDRLWLPHQAADEFLARRLGVIHARRGGYREVRDGLQKAQLEIARLVKKLHRDPVAETDSLVEGVRQPIARLIEDLEAREAELPAESNSPDEDDVWQAVDQLFRGRVGEAYNALDREEIVKEGRERYARRVPPGYMDEDKGGRKDDPRTEESAFGDLLLWYQTIDKAETEQRPVVLVTDDRKEDWWWIEHRKTIGPRPELVEEIRRRAGVTFYMYRPDRLVAEAGTRGLLGEAPVDETIDEIQDLEWDPYAPADDRQLEFLRSRAIMRYGESGVNLLESLSGKLFTDLTWDEADGLIDDLAMDFHSIPDSTILSSEDAAPLNYDVDNAVYIADKYLIGNLFREGGYSAIREADIPLAAYVDRLTTDLKSNNFDVQNKAVAALEAAGPQSISSLTIAAQELLGRCVVSAAEGRLSFGSFGAQRLIERMQSSPNRWPVPFVSGMLLEALLDDKTTFAPKYGHLAQVLKITLSHDAADILMSRAREAVRSSLPGDVVVGRHPERGRVNPYEETVAILEDLKSTMPENAHFVDALAGEVSLKERATGSAER